MKIITIFVDEKPESCNACTLKCSLRLTMSDIDQATRRNEKCKMTTEKEFLKQNISEFAEWIKDNHSSFEIPDMILQDYLNNI